MAPVVVRGSGLPPLSDRRWPGVAAAVVVVLVLLLLGVSRLGSASPSASPSTLSPYAQLFSQVRPDGTVSEETALEAFALAIAPLPGVTPPAGAAPTPAEQADGTFAIDWIQPYLGDLTDAQRAAVDAAEAPPPNAAPVISPGGSQTSRGIVLAGSSAAQPFIDGVSGALSDITIKLKRTLQLPVSVSLNATQVTPNLADTYANLSLLGSARSCSIYVNPSLVSLNDQADWNSMMAHELFHCFQFDWYDKHGGQQHPPEWIKEGQAEWVGETVAGPSNLGRDWFGTYLTSMETPLWQRTYDALGFYQHLSEEGVDPWTHMDAMLATSSNGDAYKAAGATNDTFLDTWASGEFRDSSLGTAWYAQGPWTLTAREDPHPGAVNAGQTDDVATKQVINQDLVITSTADIVEIRMQGHVRIRTDPDVVNETATTQLWLCTRDGGCTCPPGQHYAGPDFDTVAPKFELGLTGSLDGASGTLTGHDLYVFCKPNPSQQVLPPPGPCKSQCPSSNGDPHLATLNHYQYDFQAAGEFILLRSSDASLQIQARQEPHAQTNYSVNTAIAARDAGHRIGVYIVNGNLQARLDGVVLDPTLSTRFDGGRIAPYHGSLGTDGFEIDFPDGTQLWTLSVGNFGINAVIQPSAALTTGGTGLLGPITPGGMGVPAMPDGSHLPAATSEPERKGILYGTFADAWRVTDASTLFDYDPGKSTVTYVNRAFPPLNQVITYADLSSAQLAAGASACAGVTDSDLNEDCVFDVAETNETDFAVAYQQVVYLYDSGIVPVPPTPAANGVPKVADALDLQGAAVGPDDTLYVSIDTPANTAAILAINPHTGTVGHQVTVPRASDLHFAAGSLWVAGIAPDANGGKCTVSRLDPATLASRATLAIPCAFGYPGPKIVGSGSAVWYLDTSHFDPSTGKGANMVRIDPASGAPGTSVSLPATSGCCQDGQGAIYCYCGAGDEWALDENGSAFRDVGKYAPIIPVANGFWSEQGNAAVFVPASGGSPTTLPLNGQNMVGGDATGFYFEKSQSSIELWRQPADGSPPTQIATAPTFGTGINQNTPDYLIGSQPTFATTDGFAHFWLENQALYLQWAQLP